MRKDIMEDNFIEDLNVDGPDKKRNTENFKVEDFNVENTGPRSRKPKEFKVEDFNEMDKPKPAEPGPADWNRTIIEAEEVPLPGKLPEGADKTADGQQEEKTENDTESSQKSGEKKKEKKKPSVLREIASWCVTFMLAIVLAFVLKNYVIINATVPTGSMEHTIEPGDDLFGLRLAYLNSGPKRGDIIIFRYPDNEEKKFVKRVIGLPGENVKITDGRIYIDDAQKPLKEDYLKEEWIKGTGPYEYQIPEDSYLVLGDNRNDSLDARYWENTYVTKDQIIGKAYVIYYPFSHFGSLYN